MIQRMCVILAIVWVNYGLEYTADMMARLLRSGLALAQCQVWRETAAVEERRRMMTDDNLDTFAKGTRASGAPYHPGNSIGAWSSHCLACLWECSRLAYSSKTEALLSIPVGLHLG